MTGGEWELAENRVQWGALVLAGLNLRVLVPERHLKLSSSSERKKGDAFNAGQGFSSAVRFSQSTHPLMV
jgi:hypothetical protein